MDREIARDKVDLGVVGVGAATASDAIARTELGGIVADRHDFAGATVSEGRQRIELAVHFFVRGFQSVLARVLDHLLDEIGARFGFGEERLRTQLERSALRAGADG